MNPTPHSAIHITPHITPHVTPRRSSRRRLASTIGLAASFSVAGLAAAPLAGALQFPADALPGGPDRVVDTAPIDARPSDHKPEILRLACAARQTDERSAVVCKWSAPTSDQAVGVRLLRIQVGSGQGRAVVYRSSNLGVTEFVDAGVRPGHRYVYAIQALNQNGRIVGSSSAVWVGVPPIDSPTVEQLRLTCRVAEIDKVTDRVGVGCEWSLPQPGTARTLTLWRSVDGGARERIASFTHPFASSYRDVVPASTSRVVYSVTATDGDVLVAQSRPAGVVIPDGPPVTDRVIDPVTDPVIDPVSDVVTDVVIDVVTDPVTDRVTDTIIDVATDRVADTVTDRATDRATDRVTDRATDRVTDRATDRATDVAETELAD